MTGPRRLAAALLFAAPFVPLIVADLGPRSGAVVEDRHAPRTAGGTKAERPAGGRAPSSWFQAQRAYPYGEIPLHRWRDARAQAELTRRGFVSGPWWSPRGPKNVPGRITDLAVDPTDDDVVYAGTAEGGVFRTLDGGQSWTPLFDTMPALSIGAVAVDPSDPDVVYAGTGEVNPGGGSVAYGGAGLFRSTDRGVTWSLVGLETTGTIGRIVVDPTDPLTIYVAANGMHWQPNPERGVYRTTDGGATWQRVLYVDDVTGCVDLVLRPDNPDVVFASMWQHLRQPDSYDYGGPGCAIHRSDDGGDTWSVVACGLPTPSADGGRIGISLCASQPDVMHAVYADRIGFFDGLYRSVDGGATWTQTNDTDLEDVFASYGWWFGNVRTHPLDPNRIWVLGLELWTSADGGASWAEAGAAMHVDHHGLVFGSGPSPVIYAGNDGGVYRSTDGGAVWTPLPDQPHTQVYRLALDAQNPAALYIGAQDNGTSRTLTGRQDDWTPVFGGDGFQTVIDPADSGRIWAQYQYGRIFFTPDDGATWLSATTGISFADRRNWNAPHVQDPGDPSRRYAGSNRLYRSTGDRTWEAISPDLTGGPSGSTGQVDGSLTSISVSPSNPDVIWTGSNDGVVQVTVDGGVSWTDVSTALPDRWVTAVRAHPTNVGAAFATISGYRWNEPLPRIYVTTNFGSTWTAITTGLPDAPVNDLVVDPADGDRLFVATDVGVFNSRDGGGSWQVFGRGLPNVVVTSLLIDERSATLLAGTFGRSVFAVSIDDDLVFGDGFETGGVAPWSAAAP